MIINDVASCRNVLRASNVLNAAVSADHEVFTEDESKIALKPEALEMLLSGIDLKDGMQRAWYELPK